MMGFCKRITLFLCAIGFMGFATVASANVISDEYDITLKTGAHAGSIMKPAEKKGESAKSFAFGGAPIAFVFNKDYSLKLSVLMEVGIVMDLTAQQVTKQGFYGGVGYHILGGARRIVQTSEFATLATSNPYNLSLVGMGGMQHFSASEKDNTEVRIAGAIFEVVGGLQYRHDIGEESSLGLEVLQILITLPASVERLETTGTSFLFFWRIFI